MGNILIDRMIRAAKLEVSLYEEVEADQTALPQAMAVVLISSLAGGIGSIGAVSGTASTTGMGVFSILVLGLMASLLGWFIWAFLTYVIGAKLFAEPQTRSNLGELLRTIGFSSAPGVIRIFGFIPVIGEILLMMAAVWMFVAMVIAVRQALDYQSTFRAVGVCLLGWLVQILLVATFFTALVGGTP